jgi:hypothetical protein
MPNASNTVTPKYQELLITAIGLFLLFSFTLAFYREFYKIRFLVSHPSELDLPAFLTVLASILPLLASIFLLRRHRFGWILTIFLLVQNIGFGISNITLYFYLFWGHEDGYFFSGWFSDPIASGTSVLFSLIILLYLNRRPLLHRFSITSTMRRIWLTIPLLVVLSVWLKESL